MKEALPPPPGTRVDLYGDHYPRAITVHIVDIGDPDRWRLCIDTWAYDYLVGQWVRQRGSELTPAELRKVFEYVTKHAPGVLK